MTATDYAGLTERQKTVWADGDFHIVSWGVMPVSESIVAAVDVHAGERVLDVACGTGNAALVAARRHADVTGIDIVPSLIDRAKRRAEAEGLKIDFQVGDAQELAVADGSFDVVVSVFGVMFAPNQERAANELLRATRSGGRIGVMSWIPSDFSADFFKVHGKYSPPPPPGFLPPVRWGTESVLREELFTKAKGVSSLSLEPWTFHQYFRSEDHAFDTFKSYFGPTKGLLAALASDPTKQSAFEKDLREVFRNYNRAKHGSGIAIESKCLRLIATKA